MQTMYWYADGYIVFYYDLIALPVFILCFMNSKLMYQLYLSKVHSLIMNFEFEPISDKLMSLDRVCEWERKFDVGCDYNKGGGNETITCICDTDKCNHASMPTTNFMLLVTALLGVCLR